MHKWHLLLLLILNLLQSTLSEHIVIDGRQYCGHSSSRQDERFNGKYRFDKRISDKLRLNTLRENPEDDHHYRFKNGEHDTRFSRDNRLERRILTTYDRSGNVYERKLYRTVDEGSTYDRNFINKLRQNIHNDAPNKVTYPYARISYENQERQISENFGSNPTPLETRRTLNEKSTFQDTSDTRRQSAEYWFSNLNNLNLYRTLERTGTNIRNRLIIEKRKIDENNGDLFRQNIRKRDLTTDSNRLATGRIGSMTKLSDRNIVRDQYRLKVDEENRISRNIVGYFGNNIREINSMPTEDKIYQRDVKQIKDQHIINGLHVAPKSFERNFNQRKPRSTSGKRTNLRDERFDARKTERDDERQSDGKNEVNKQVSRSRIHDQTDIREQERYARDNHNRVVSEISVLRNQRQQNTMRITSKNTVPRLEEHNIDVRDGRMDNKIPERYARDNNERAFSVERNIRQDVRRVIVIFAARSREEQDTGVNDKLRDSSKAKIYLRDNTPNRQTFTGHNLSRKDSNRARDTYVTYDRKEQNRNTRDKHSEHRIHERCARDIRNMDRYIIDDFDQKFNADEHQIRRSDVTVRQRDGLNNENHDDRKMYENNKGTAIRNIEWNVKGDIRKNTDHERTSMHRNARITDQEIIERTFTHNSRKTISDEDVAYHSRKQRNTYVRDERFDIKNGKSDSKYYKNYDRSLEVNVYRENIRRVMDEPINRSRKTSERQDDFKNYVRDDKDNSRRIAFPQRAILQNSERISDAYDSRKGKEVENINKRDVLVIADRNNARYLTNYMFRSQDDRNSDMRYDRTKIIRTNTDARNSQKYLRDDTRDIAPYPTRQQNTNIHEDERNEWSNAENLKITIMKRSASVERALHQTDVSRVTDRQITRNRDELNTLLERNSKYIRAKAVSKERDVRTVKDEQKEIKYNTRGLRLDDRETVARITHKPVAFIREERTAVSSELVDITTNERNLIKSTNERTISSRHEHQRNARMTPNESITRNRDVRNKRKENRIHLTNAERLSRYNTRERALLVERKVPKLGSRSVTDDDVKYIQEIQKVNVNKERKLMTNNARYSRLSIRQRTASTEQNLNLRNDRTQPKANKRNTHVWNTQRFVRINAQERVIAEETREQSETRITDSQITRRDKESDNLRERRTQTRDTTQRRQPNYFLQSRTESRIRTLRTDERNYRTEGNLHIRSYDDVIQRSSDLYLEIESTIRNSYRNLQSYMDVERDNSRRHTESAYKRNTFVSTKTFVNASTPENLSTTLFYWQYLFYAIQGIYIFFVFAQIFQRKEKDTKTSSMTWYAGTPHIKVD